LSADLSVRVFGGLVLERDGREVDIEPARARTVLASLLLREGERVRIDELIAELWTDEAPLSAVNQVHRLIGQVRRLLDPSLGARDSGDVVIGSADSYRLVLPPRTSDIGRFRTELAAANAASDTAFTHLLNAMSIAPAPVLPELEPGSPLGIRARALESERVRAALSAIDLALASDRASTLLSTAERLAAEHPLDEAVHARLVRVMAASGKRADAIDLARTTRERLRIELGLDAGDELLRAINDVVASDQPDEVFPESPLPPPPTMRQAYLERAEAQAALDRAASSALRDGAITVVSGIGGVGKTTMVVEWARDTAHRFRDGVLYLDLRGFLTDAEALTQADAMKVLLPAVGVADVPENASLHDQLMRYRTAMQRRELLLILDNALDVAQVRPLLPSWSHSLTVVISRNRLSGLVAREGADALLLEGLDDRQATSLIRSRIGAGRADAEPDAMERIVDRCGGLPLALAIVGARAATEGGSLSALADALESPQPLDALDTDSADESVRRVLAWSVERLSAPARTAFESLSVYPGSEFSPDLVQSLTGSALDELSRSLEELLAASILSAGNAGRLRIHDLLRDLAGELTPDDVELALTERLVWHFVRTADEVYRVAIGRDQAAEGEPRVPAEPIPDFSTGFLWYQTDRLIYHRVLELADELGLDVALCRLLNGVGFVLDAAESRQEQLRMLVPAMLAAERTGDPALILPLRRRRARNLDTLGRLEEADVEWVLAAESAEAAADPEMVADVYRSRAIGAMWRPEPDFELALDYSARSIAAGRLCPDTPALFGALCNRAHAFASLGRNEESIADLEEALALSVSAPSLVGAALGSLGAMYSEVGRFQEAAELCERAALDRAASGDEYEQATSWSFSAVASMKAGDVERARRTVAAFDALITDEAAGRIRELHERAGQADDGYNLDVITRDLDPVREWLATVQ
jgi:DNA-binding SARP family transcriptional activator